MGYTRALRTTRGAAARLDLGDYYIVDHQTGGAPQTHVDIESLGRELGVLAYWERVE